MRVVVTLCATPAWQNGEQNEGGSDPVCHPAWQNGEQNEGGSDPVCHASMEEGGGGRGEAHSRLQGETCASTV